MNNPSNMIKVAVVGGEGIGPEVTAQSHRVLNWFAAQARRADDAARGAIRPHPLSGDRQGDAAGHRRGDGRGRRHPLGRHRRPGDHGSARRGAQGRQACCRCAASTTSTPTCGRSSPTRRLPTSAPLKARRARGRRFRHHPRTHQRHLFRRAARHRDAARRPAPRLQHRAIHHRPDSPRGPGRLRTGAHPQGQGLLGGQGQCAGDRAGCGARRCTALHEAEFPDVELQPSLCRQRRHADSCARRRSST